ncbi:MAG: GNAT family N-acetyltransferase [Acidobacteriota bacterium]|nr:GNAT family N-acetyltransferase [Acidobacteriota bacterium]
MTAEVDTTNIVIRKCTTVAEFQDCVGLQKEVWNFADVDLIPLRLFVVADRIGGQIIGSFDGDELVGFALSIPGSRGGHPYLHSHMLAVRERYRNAGLGKQMKLLQREDGIARGFELIEWTFDPLEIKNSFLNLERLGAIARRYNINQYGISSSPLQGGLPTDRLVAEWWLQSRRVKVLLEGGSRPNVAVEKTIAVPAQIYQWKADEKEREKARDIQLGNREEFLRAFSAGLTVLGYERDQEGNGRFLLGRWDERWGYATAPGEEEQREEK